MTIISMKRRNKKHQLLNGFDTMVNAKLFKTEKKYLSAKEDKELDGKVLLIDSVFPEEIKSTTGEVKESLCMRFRDIKKVLSLNQTNLNACITVFGENTDEWVNNKVKFLIVNVNPMGGNDKGIQIVPQ
jgi:hypothetical protein